MSAPIATNAAAYAPLTSFRFPGESGRAGALVVVGAFLACFAAQGMAVALWVPPARLSTVWVSGGLMLAIALVTAPRRWPAVITAAAAGSTALFLSLRLVPATAAILIGLAAGIHTIAIAFALRRVWGRPVVLASLREFLVYAGIAVVGGAVVASFLLLAIAWGTRIRPASLYVWRTFALAVALGYLTATPMVVLLVREIGSFRGASPRRCVEAALLALLLVIASGFVFTGHASRGVTWAAFAMTLPPLLLWSATRFGMLGASASLLLVSVVSTLGASRGLGPFSDVSAAENTLMLQLFMLGTGLPLLGLTAVLGEHTRTRADLQSSQLRLSGLNRELIAAREEEATRIARELHDDVGQRLALVSIGLSRLRRARAIASNEHLADVVRLQEQTRSIARTLRQLSHELYPASLEHVGLASALQLKGDEVHGSTGLSVRVLEIGAVAALPRDVALCLFRVSQEALNNVIRHAGANRVDLTLQRQGGALLLQIVDDGRGFDAAAPRHRPGLGLRSAAERVRSVGGTLSLESRPGFGTTVRVSVPIEEGDDAQAARDPRG